MTITGQAEEGDRHGGYGKRNHKGNDGMDD